MSSSGMDDRQFESGVAIIGMAGRFPGAADIDAFWRNLRGGVESIKVFSSRELEAAGLDPSRLRDPSYVPAYGHLSDIDKFDDTFFGFTPREAEITDPQHRLFLECAWQALESAGYDARRYQGLIGVYAGCSNTEYMKRNVYAHPEVRDSVGDFQLNLAGDRDFLATRVSYKLDLHGPGMTIQTACSTSLVTVCMAWQALLTYQCDLALAGGVSINLDLRYGYSYRDGMIFSPDGHCRPFDEHAQGTVGGEGVGVVALKRLKEAIADGDFIYAVIRGTALNNDGSAKIGYTAPSVDGQAQVIAQAQAVGDVAPETVSYIEAHGTATPLGDPIEIAALSQVFGNVQRGSCAIGSVKGNIGHLDAAAGIAGLIKTTLALHHRELPPSLHFERPNPKLGLEHSPFYVNHRLAAWASTAPRRAGVSSFGIGGTNAHVVLQEAPPAPAAAPVPLPLEESQLLVLSARSATALDAAATNLAAHLRAHPELPLADVAHTLQVGRRAFSHRQALVCSSHAQAVAALSDKAQGLSSKSSEVPDSRSVVFLFPGQGNQYPGIARELYDSEPTFREWLDRCATLAAPSLGLDLRAELFSADVEDMAAQSDRLGQMHVAQPLVFAIEYALARMWMSFGVTPTAMLGHSVGEYVAACLSGVFSLEDALWLLVMRGQLMQSLPRGSMLAVPLAEAEVLPLLGPSLSLAAVNGPALCVVAGPQEAVSVFQDRLRVRETEGNRITPWHEYAQHTGMPHLHAQGTFPYT